jgi:hypothetical protein
VSLHEETVWYGDFLFYNSMGVSECCVNMPRQPSFTHILSCVMVHQIDNALPPYLTLLTADETGEEHDVRVVFVRVSARGP